MQLRREDNKTSAQGGVGIWFHEQLKDHSHRETTATKIDMRNDRASCGILHMTICGNKASVSFSPSELKPNSVWNKKCHQTRTD
eukprot:2934170-Amphidinium_carterae.2